MGSGVYCVDLIHEEAKYRLYLDIYETAAVFSTRVYLATGVIPARQCIVGFQVMLTARQQETGISVCTKYIVSQNTLAEGYYSLSWSV